MISRSEKIRLITRAILYIIAVTLYCMFREIKQKAITLLPNLRLFKHTADELFSSTTASYEYPINTITTHSHIFMVDGYPSLSPIPNHIVTAAIKLTLPIIRYADFLHPESNQDTTTNGCVVCWECVQQSDEIRDLPNCRHVFHRDCLDRWVDEAQVTCPLCRSMLLPPLTNPWAVVRESNSALQQEQEQDQQQIISQY
ncbi:RING-H2 finger protein ATL70-like [Impatiens glandulifera]|uniref:RING-H2 finger protein ATL70-like n=1 Tax=Impatiens glandulifera TaxID=253017 RepID=UPI001FB0A5EB|nr:RING-H2 finger protein ATL70-like [Impatiens glandulifera]